MSLSAIPQELIASIAGFLTLTDCNRLAATCKTLYSHCNILVVKAAEDIVREDLEEANEFYCQVSLNKTITVHEENFTLKLIQFSFQTKDQGWVSGRESRSWIEAEFVRKTGHSERCANISDERVISSSRVPLVWNYEAKHYQEKTKCLEITQTNESPSAVRLYLRSTGARNTISCRSATIKLYYASENAVISEKQLPRSKPVRGKKRILGV